MQVSCMCGAPRVDEPFFHIETGVDLDVASPTTPLRIAAVSNGSVGDQSGLRPGDVIVQVDGKPTAGWTRRDWREALLRRIGGSASLRVRRGDHIIAVRLPVVDALQLPNRR